MDIYDDDLLSFWQALNKNQVKYIMAGGFAVNMPGQQKMPICGSMILLKIEKTCDRLSLN